ncbi:hypothetical protein JQ621_01380 [Bradyrhizobium manausense]|uniref:hypothetical protein n=1 Tax=Bradyrhizobium manausense TaxID=989370 RepID=UPI001BABCFEF|nr:hypothetical protein [Bradyrhizobium manausense]MBR1086121.1 hypothetical protein [Bradyrhizobium manausense]
MTRFSAAILFGLCLGLCGPGTGWAQDSERCFPWQEFRGGICVAKSAPIAPVQVPAAPDVGPPPAPAETNAAPPPLVCPPNSHIEGGACITDVAPPPAAPRALITITCNGGAASDGRCTCPAGFQLMPADTDLGGTCVRSNAENCLGGQTTVAGECLCIGQVTMSGQVYDLEFVRGKCVPKRCPRDGACVTAATPPATDASSKSPSGERPRDCGSGMVATRQGCVPARHRSQPAAPNTYLRIRPNYPGPMHY